MIQMQIKGSNQADRSATPLRIPLISGQFEGRDIVCGVASGGEDATPCTGLIERTHIQRF